MTFWKNDESRWNDLDVCRCNDLDARWLIERDGFSGSRAGTVSE